MTNTKYFAIIRYTVKKERNTIKITGKTGIKSLEEYAQEINRKHFRKNKIRVFKHPNHENVFIIVKDNKFKLIDWESISCDKALFCYILKNLDKLRDAEY